MLSRVGITGTVDSAALPALQAAADPELRGDRLYGPKRVIGGRPMQQELLWPPLTDLNEAGRLWDESERRVGARFAVPLQLTRAEPCIPVVPVVPAMAFSCRGQYASALTRRPPSILGGAPAGTDVEIRWEVDSGDSEAPEKIPIELNGVPHAELDADETSGGPVHRRTSSRAFSHSRSPDPSKAVHRWGPESIRPPSGAASVPEARCTAESSPEAALTPGARYVLRVEVRNTCTATGGSPRPSPSPAGRAGRARVPPAQRQAARQGYRGIRGAESERADLYRWLSR